MRCAENYSPFIAVSSPSSWTLKPYLCTVEKEVFVCSMPLDVMS